ncbi:MAG: hypothetical protein LBB52_07925 [Desulfovibrio sp.]|nr:hypothetical protein [Desulfovibrio sp.]
MAAEIPATGEVILKSDTSKQFLDTLLGQGWDAWGEGLAALRPPNSCWRCSAPPIW